MQFSTSLLKLKWFTLLIIAVMVSACFKKNEEAAQLNSNVFDREYAGERWFEITDINQVTNDLGQIRARLDVVIPRENLPELKPSNITVQITAEGIDTQLIDFPLSYQGDYLKKIDLPYTGVGEYCITLGIFVSSDDSVINSFTTCAAI